MAVKAVEGHAQLLRIRTRSDRTADVTLNVPEYCKEQVMEMLGHLMDEIDFVFVFPDKQEVTDSGTVSSRSERKSRRATT